MVCGESEVAHWQPTCHAGFHFVLVLIKLLLHSIGCTGGAFFVVMSDAELLVVGLKVRALAATRRGAGVVRRLSWVSSTSSWTAERLHAFIVPLVLNRFGLDDCAFVGLQKKINM